MFTSMLLAPFGDVLTNMVAIFILVVLGAFLIALILDLIFYAASPKSNGLFFNRRKKGDYIHDTTYQQRPERLAAPYEQLQNTPPKQLTNQVTVTPFDLNEDVFTFDDTDTEFLEEVHSVDFEKAVQEQKLIQGRTQTFYEDDNSARRVSDFDLFTLQESNNIVTSKLEDFEEDDVESNDEDILEIIKEVQTQAMNAIAAKPVEKVRIIQEVVEPVVQEKVRIIQDSTKPNQVEKVVVEKPEVIEPVKVRLIRPKLIYKVMPQPEPVVVKEEPIVVEEKVVVEEPYNEFRDIRDDIFRLKVSSFKDLHKTKNGLIPVTKKVEEEFESEVIEKLKTIETLTLKEKEELLKENTETKTKKQELEKELLTLEAEIANLKNNKIVVEVPTYSKAYYENRLAELLKNEAEVDKDLRKNNRVFGPLKRIKRTLERDIVKLRRKEAIVAKQKLRIYGVNNSSEIDPDKLKKLDEEVAVLTELKDSVYNCETILKQNKDRYPVLESSNNHLTRHLAAIRKDIAEVKRQISLFDEDENSGL